MRTEIDAHRRRAAIDALLRLAPIRQHGRSHSGVGHGEDDIFHRPRAMPLVQPPGKGREGGKRNPRTWEIPGEEFFAPYTPVGQECIAGEPDTLRLSWPEPP